MKLLVKVFRNKFFGFLLKKFIFPWIEKFVKGTKTEFDDELLQLIKDHFEKLGVELK